MNTLTDETVHEQINNRQERLDVIDVVKKNIHYFKPGDKSTYTTPSFEPVMYVTADLGHFWMISEVVHPEADKPRYFVVLMGGSDWTATEARINGYKALQKQLLRLFSLSDILYAIGMKTTDSVVTSI